MNWTTDRLDLYLMPLLIIGFFVLQTGATSATL
jgi:hypothetical protein